MYGSVLKGPCKGVDRVHGMPETGFFRTVWLRARPMVEEMAPRESKESLDCRF
jgi:hypothetical protein